MKIIGICGTNGSGKDTLAEMLVERHGWLMVQYSDFLRDEARNRGLAIERKNLHSISTEWRAKHGNDILTRKSVDLFNESPKKYKGLVVLSMRHPGEANKVHELGGKVVWVDADPKIRYKRVSGRARSDEDVKTYEEFLDDQEREMYHSEGSSSNNMAGVKKLADIFIENNGDDLEVFKDEAEKALKDLL